MTYVAFDQLNKDQRLAVLAHVSEPNIAWLLARNFAIKKDGTVHVPLYTRTAPHAAAIPDNGPVRT